MTYILVCLLCTAATYTAVPGDHASTGSSPQLTASLRVPDLTTPGRPVALRTNASAPLSFSDHDGGPSEGAHVGPMWIAMGAMMVAMMVVAGAYMMRGHWATPLQQGVGVPHQAALPPVGVFRPGG